MSKQDRQGVRSPTDIERKYDLSSVAGLKKAVKTSETNITKTNAILESFVNETTKNMIKLQDEMNKVDSLKEAVDSKVEIWFYSGVPTLENEPVSTWTEEGYGVHLGDQYYDKDTGYVYLFVYENDEYCWVRIQDRDIAESLALANSAKDTADGKRRVFTVCPSPPYDNGDLWVHNQELYICQISKGKDEEYAEEDFVIATKYTDDTYATQVENELKVVRGTVALLEANVDSVNLEFETTVKTVNELKEEVTESTEKMKYSFDTEDFTVSKDGADTSTHISEDGMKVVQNSSGQVVLTATSDGVGARNLHATTYLIIGNNSRMEDYEEDGEVMTGVFWIGN